jgi:hypothetical protein
MMSTIIRSWVSKKMNEQQLAYATAVANGVPMAAAYRLHYDPVGATVAEIDVLAAAVRAIPAVADAITRLERDRISKYVRDPVAVLTDLAALASADPNEIVEHRRLSCRHCYGLGHSYQWRTEDEWVEAAAKAMDAQKDAPLAKGGYGYDHLRRPNPECPQCGGEGKSDVYIKDTRYLSYGARKLYGGLKPGKQGSAPEVIFRNQDSALQTLARSLGLLTDKLDINAHTTTSVDMTALTDEQLAAIIAARHD